jgi:hypothetical protein
MSNKRGFRKGSPQPCKCTSLVLEKTGCNFLKISRVR